MSSSSSGDEDSQEEYPTSGPQPYAFEPIIRANSEWSQESEDSQNTDITSDDESDIEGTNNEGRDNDEPEGGQRFTNHSWCSCGNCSVATLTYNTECICCQEIAAISHKLSTEEEDLMCITSNVYFGTFCLDVEALDLALLTMADVKAESLIRPISSW